MIFPTILNSIVVLYILLIILFRNREWLQKFITSRFFDSNTFLALLVGGIALAIIEWFIEVWGFIGGAFPRYVGGFCIVNFFVTLALAIVGFVGGKCTEVTNRKSAANNTMTEERKGQIDEYEKEFLESSVKQKKD